MLFYNCFINVTKIEKPMHNQKIDDLGFRIAGGNQGLSTKVEKDLNAYCTQTFAFIIHLTHFTFTLLGARNRRDSFKINDGSLTLEDRMPNNYQNLIFYMYNYVPISTDSLLYR